jgi:negative regulator of flagellin synthesis FlgM
MKGITGNPALDAYNRMAISPVGGARAVDRVEGTTKSSADSPAAEVQISSRARDLALEANNANVDAQKVDALKQRLADGSFRIDSQMIATRMIEQLG